MKTLREHTAELDVRLSELAKLEKVLTKAQDDADSAVITAKKAYFLSVDAAQDAMDIDAVQKASDAIKESQAASEKAQQLSFEYRRMLDDTVKKLYDTCSCYRGDSGALKIITEHLDAVRIGRTARAEFTEVITQMKAEENLVTMQDELQQMLEKHSSPTGLSRLVDREDLAEIEQELEQQTEKDSEQDKLIAENTKLDNLRDKILAAHTENDRKLDRLIAENAKRDAMRDRILAAHTENDRKLDQMISENAKRDAERDSLLAKQIVKDVQLDRLISENEHKDERRDELIAEQAAKSDALEQLLDENIQKDSERDNILAKHTASDIELRRLVDEQHAEIMELNEKLKALLPQGTGRAVPCIALVLSVIALVIACVNYFL